MVQRLRLCASNAGRSWWPQRPQHSGNDASAQGQSNQWEKAVNYSTFTHLGRSVVSDSVRPHGPQPTGLLCSWNFPGKNTRVGCRFLLQGIFLTQGLSPRLLHALHWRAASLPLNHQRCGYDPSVEKISWRRKWQSTLVFLPGKFHEQRSLEGYTPWGRKEADLTEHARHTFYALKAILIKTEAPSHFCFMLGF